MLYLTTDEIVRTLGEGTFGKVTECIDLEKSVLYCSWQCYCYDLTIEKNVTLAILSRDFVAQPYSATKQVRVEPPPSAVNMTLPAFAAARRPQLSIDVCCRRRH